MTNNYDLIVIGAGSGGLTAAEFAARLGARVALVEKGRIGGDCTWTGCVPSKALLKVARVAHQARTAETFGVVTGPSQVDMGRVRDYVRRAIDAVHHHETPEVLANKGIDVIFGAAHFIDAHTVQLGEQHLSAKKFIITTGAQPSIPPVPGLDEVPYQTYLDIFDNDYLPERLLVMGAGPIGSELAQAYQRLGAQVSLIDVGLLPGEEPEVGQIMGQVFAREGIQFVEGLVSAARQENDEIVLEVNERDVRGDRLLVAVGRTPNVTGLGLDRIGLDYSAKGIKVDKALRTNIKHIYAAGDCVAGNYQFTHVAGRQGFQAARNALLPTNSPGFDEVVPWATFTDPEVAHVGLTEAKARETHGDVVKISTWSMAHTDRAIADNDQDGFIKVVHRKNGQVLGATIVSSRAGEAITEMALALKHGLKLVDLANVIHVYPTYAAPIMQLSGQVTIGSLLDGRLGPIIRWISKVTR
jgi:pyruvate/2-oxoglutarate dehydrogenase complex dihydrolipoamide dehydrogenase (E3) component